MPITSLREAIAVAHTLSEPSKMPGYGYSIPADTCKLGALLRQRPGTVCSKCYALKGRYTFPNTQAAMAKRFASLRHPDWVEAVAYQINLHARRSRTKDARYFRWHDAGDLQGVWHLDNIAAVCRLTPTVHHWLPTRELKVVHDWLKLGNNPPENLVIRLSAPKVGELPSSLARLGLPVSSVGMTNATPAEQCLAYTRGGVCGDCRLCWSSAPRVNYPLH